MLGAVIGDIVGSPYEFVNIYSRRGIKPFAQTLRGKCRFTDDTVLSMAVARALIDCQGTDDIGMIGDAAAERIQEYYWKYPLKRFLVGSSYGNGFADWVRKADIHEKRGAVTNGGAMRATPVGWMCSSLDETLRVAKAVTERSHNSPNSIEGAQMVAAAVFLARCTKDKDVIKRYEKAVFGYSLADGKGEYYRLQNENKEYRAEKRRKGKNYIDCAAKRTVSEALFAFFNTEDFKSCIRMAIAIGGDSDTIACMAGGIAEAFYGGVPNDWKKKAVDILEECKCGADDIAMAVNFRDRAVPVMADWEKGLPDIFFN